jgi:hypothetical protein
MNNTLAIHRAVHSLTAFITDFKAMRTAFVPQRHSSLCGFDGFVDTFVRSGRSASFADMKNAGCAGGWNAWRADLSSRRFPPTNQSPNK